MKTQGPMKVTISIRIWKVKKQIRNLDLKSKGRGNPPAFGFSLQKYINYLKYKNYGITF